MMKKYSISLLVVGLISSGCFSPNQEEKLEDLRDKYPSYGVISDPYIKNAIICEDKNKNNICDAGEQNATASRSDGMFFFEKELTKGSNIIVAKQGKHNGKFYTLNLQTSVENPREVVLTPLTHLVNLGLTKNQVATMLQKAGLEHITEKDIAQDPMEGLNSLTSLQNDEDLEKLQASLAVYGMLRVLQSVPEFKKMTSEELYINATTQNQPIATILKTMVGAIKEGLNKDIFTLYKTKVNALHSKFSFMPEAKLGTLIETSVTIMNRLIEIAFEAANSYDGTLEQKIQKALEAVVQNKQSVFNSSSSLMMKFFGLNHQKELAGKEIDDKDITQGVELEEAHFILGEDNKVATLPVHSSAVRVFLEADKNTKPYEHINALTCNEVVFIDPNMSDTPLTQDGLDCNHNFGVAAHQTPQRLKFAIKSISITDKDGKVFYILNKEKLKDSAVFDASEKLELGTLDIPNAYYTKIKVEYYYYWYSLEMYKKGNFVNFRVYMSDDDFENEGHNEGERPHHQGDITLTDANNREIGVIAPGEVWEVGHTTELRTEPDENQIKLYASDPDLETHHQRGPFGDTEYWNQKRLNQGPNKDILFYENSINLDLSDEVKNITLKFNAKDSWAFEDCPQKGVYDTRPIYQIIDACKEYDDFEDVNVTQDGKTYNCACSGGWSPELKAPEIVIY